MKHLLFVPAFALLATMALVGCSDDNGGTDPRIPATLVVVDVTEQELHVGETLQLTATPTPANTTDKVQWTSDDSAMLATYTPTAVSMDQFWFKVIVTGYLGQTEVGTVDCLLTDHGVTQSGWTKVDLSRLGQVDRLTFTIDSNDTGEWGVNAPAYFGLDEIGFPKEEQ